MKVKVKVGEQSFISSGQQRQRQMHCGLIPHKDNECDCREEEAGASKRARTHIRLI